MNGGCPPPAVSSSTNRSHPSGASYSSSSSSSSSSTEVTFDAALLRAHHANVKDSMDVCDSPMASARSSSRKSRRVVPVSLSSSLLLPHRKRIKMTTGSPGAAAPPPFRGDDNDDEGSVALSTMLPPPPPTTTSRCPRLSSNGDGGYDASANLSDNDSDSDSDSDSETSMSFGGADNDDDVAYDVHVTDDTEMGDDEDDEEEEIDVESSFSELSYDGAEFDFGYYGRRQQILVRPGGAFAGDRFRSPRHSEVMVIEVPIEVRQDMDRRALESEEEYRRTHGQRIPVELQEVFVRAQRGEPVDHPPASGIAFHVFPWPTSRAAAESHRQTSSGTQPPTGAEAPTLAPTQPRRRGSLSAASTLQDDDFTDGIAACNGGGAPLVLDRWRPLSRCCEPRVPIELQGVFVRAQQGQQVDPPPTRGIAFKVFDPRWGGAAAPHQHHHHHHHNHHHRPAGMENEAHPAAAWTRHE